MDDSRVVNSNINFYAVYTFEVTDVEIIFMTWDINDKMYVKENTLYLPKGSLFKNDIRDKYNPKIKNFYDDVQYYVEFQYWTEVEGQRSIITEAQEANWYEPITTQKRYFAKYTRTYTDYTVKFMSCKTNGKADYTLLDTKRVARGTQFGNIDKPKVADWTYSDTPYKYFGWISTTSPIDGGSIVNNNSVITKDITVYATYTIDCDSLNYLGFEAKGGTLTVKMDVKKHTGSYKYSTREDIDGELFYNVSMQYKTSAMQKFADYTWGGSKTVSKENHNGITISLKEGEKVWFKGNNEKMSNAICYVNVQMEGTGMCTCSGDVMSLSKNPTYISDDWFFSRFFKDNKKITNTPKMGATIIISQGCYAGMYAYCTNLKTCEDFPTTVVGTITVVGERSMIHMYYNCTSLTRMPSILPYPTKNAYQYMFENCTSLPSDEGSLPSCRFTRKTEYTYKWVKYNAYHVDSVDDPPSDSAFKDMFKGCTDSYTKYHDFYYKNYVE